jgi:hypothetical protein
VMYCGPIDPYVLDSFPSFPPSQSPSLPPFLLSSLPSPARGSTRHLRRGPQPLRWQ